MYYRAFLNINDVCIVYIHCEINTIDVCGDCLSNINDFLTAWISDFFFSFCNPSIVHYKMTQREPTITTPMAGFWTIRLPGIISIRLNQKPFYSRDSGSNSTKTSDIHRFQIHLRHYYIYLWHWFDNHSLILHLDNGRKLCKSIIQTQPVTNYFYSTFTDWSTQQPSKTIKSS